MTIDHAVFRMPIDTATKLEPGTQVRDNMTGAVGEVAEPSLPGMFKVRWITPIYDRQLRDYIASSEWDLLDLDGPDSLPISGMGLNR